VQQRHLHPFQLDAKVPHGVCLVLPLLRADNQPLVSCPATAAAASAFPWNATTATADSEPALGQRSCVGVVEPAASKMEEHT
jgi:hypothetical protein